MNNRCPKLICISIAAMCFAMGLIGCSNKNASITASRLRWNPTPSLETMNLTHQQRLNRISRSLDTNMRQFNDDIDSFLLIDHAMRFSNVPMP